MSKFFITNEVSWWRWRFICWSESFVTSISFLFVVSVLIQYAVLFWREKGHDPLYIWEGMQGWHSQSWTPWWLPSVCIAVFSDSASCIMRGIKLQTAYALVVTLFLLLSLDFIVQWHYCHKRSLLYLCIRILCPNSYITFTFLATYRVLLSWLISGSLWVCLDLKARHQKHLLLQDSWLTLRQALIIWRFCRLLKDDKYGRAYKVLQFGSWQMTFSIYQLLLIAVLLIVIALHAVAFDMPHHHNDCYICTSILAFSNCLVSLLALISAYYVWKREHHYQKKAQGMVVTSEITCLAAVSSLRLLRLLTNCCDWPKIILISRGLFLKPLSDVASWRLSQHGLMQYRGPCCKSEILFQKCPMCKMLKAYIVVFSLLWFWDLILDFNLSICWYRCDWHCTGYCCILNHSTIVCTGLPIIVFTHNNMFQATLSMSKLRICYFAWVRTSQVTS